MNTVAPDISPTVLLTRFRGRVTEGRLTPSRRIYLGIEDAAGGRWRLISWEAGYSATFPGSPEGKTVTAAELDDGSGDLTVNFSDGTSFTVSAIPDESADAIESWELFTPERMVLAYGPWGSWRFGDADDREYWARPIARP